MYLSNANAAISLQGQWDAEARAELDRDTYEVVSYLIDAGRVNACEGDYDTDRDAVAVMRDTIGTSMAFADYGDAVVRFFAARGVTF